MQQGYILMVGLKRKESTTWRRETIDRYNFTWHKKKKSKTKTKDKMKEEKKKPAEEEKKAPPAKPDPKAKGGAKADPK